MHWNMTEIDFLNIFNVLPGKYTDYCENQDSKDLKFSASCDTVRCCVVA
jgi:hypothetical protein